MKKILVLFGGCSPEYAVSLQSAYSVLRHMDRERYRPIPVGITQAGDWFLYTGKWEAILAGTWQERHCLPAAVSPNRRDHGLLVWRRGGMEIIPLDGAFPVLHGKNGEDGTVQGLLELAGSAGQSLLSDGGSAGKARLLLWENPPAGQRRLASLPPVGRQLCSGGDRPVWGTEYP